jgi:hypothetical protein
MCTAFSVDLVLVLAHPPANVVTYGAPHHLLRLVVVHWLLRVSDMLGLSSEIMMERTPVTSV